MEYWYFHLASLQLDSPFMAACLENPDILPLILDCEEPRKKTNLEVIYEYTWRSFPAYLSLFHIGRRTDMVTVLACTCKRMFNLIQAFMNPHGLSSAYRQFLYQKYEEEWWEANSKGGKWNPITIHGEDSEPEPPVIWNPDPADPDYQDYMDWMYADE